MVKLLAYVPPCIQTWARSLMITLAVPKVLPFVTMMRSVFGVEMPEAVGSRM